MSERRIDLGRYAGTYGGHYEPAQKRTLWRCFKAWIERKGWRRHV